MQRFEAYEDRDCKWRWRLMAANSTIIASSGESFASQAGALRAAEDVRATAPGAAISIAPGLGIKAALRLRALLAATDGGGEGTSDLQRRRVRAARPHGFGGEDRHAGRMPAPDRRLATVSNRGSITASFRD